MKVCTVDGLKMEDKEPCVRDNPKMKDSDCDILMRLKAEKAGPKQCLHYVDYKQKKLSKVEQLERENAELKALVEQMKCCGNCKSYQWQEMSGRAKKYCIADEDAWTECVSSGFKKHWRLK